MVVFGALALEVYMLGDHLCEKSVTVKMFHCLIKKL